MNWDEFARLFARDFRREVTRSITSGPVVLNDGSSFYAIVYGHEAGLVLCRRFRPFSKKVWLEWRQVARIAVLPPFLSGKMKRHTDAVLTLSEDQLASVKVPWMDDFERLLPEEILLTRRERR